jgi:hypothetical protein
MLKGWFLIAAPAAALQLGCMANATRHTAVTTAPEVRRAVPEAVRGRRVAVSMDVQGAQIKGGHHEGLMQVRQPWIFGLKTEQKALLYDNAPQVAALGFSSELQRQGLAVNPEDADYVLTAVLKTVTLNTYGHGTTEGYGSAGNYWEARVAFAEATLADARTGRVVARGPREGYAKHSPSPARLDWTMLDLLAKSLKGAMILHDLKTAKNPTGILTKGKDYLYNFEGTYTMDEVKETPIDLAARVAAASLLEQAAW